MQVSVGQATSEAIDLTEDSPQASGNAAVSHDEVSDTSDDDLSFLEDRRAVGAGTSASHMQASHSNNPCGRSSQLYCLAYKTPLLHVAKPLR